MKTFFYSTVFFLLLSFQGWAQLSANLNIPTRVSGRVADWIGESRTQRFLLTVVNPSGLEFRGYLKIKIFNASGKLIVESIDERQELQVFSAGATIIDLLDVLVLDGNIATVRHYDNSLVSKLKSGFLPEENYQVCVHILDTDTRNPLIPSEICKFIYPITYQAPILLQPLNNSEVEAVRSRLILRWNGVSPNPPFPVRYHVQVFEVLQGQTPEIAFRANTPILDEFVTGATQLVWPPSYDMPRVGGIYVWNVRALDNDNIPVGEPDGRGVPFVFKAISYGLTKEDIKTENTASKSALKAPQEGNVLYSIAVRPQGNASQTVSDVKVRVEPASDKQIRYQTEKVQTGTQKVIKKVVEEQNGKKVTVQKTVEEPVFTEIKKPYYEESKEFKEYTTNEEGKIIFEAASGAELLVSTYVDGKLVGTPEKIVVPEAKPTGETVEEPKPFSIYIPPKQGELIATFLDKRSNQPVKGIPVEIYQKNAEGKDQLITSTSTDENGKIAVSVPAGEGYYAVIKNEQFQDFISKSISVEAEKTTSIDSKSISLIPHTATIKVKIVDKTSEKPLANADVLLFTPSRFDEFLENPSSSPLAKAVSSSIGEATLKEIPINSPSNETDTYVLAVVSETHQLDYQMITVKKGSENVDITVKTTPLEKILQGQVKNEKGQVMANARIELVSSEGKVLATAQADGNGKYTVAQLPSQPISNIVFSSVGNLPQIVEATAILGNPATTLSSNTSPTTNNTVIALTANGNLTSPSSAAQQLKGKVVNQFGEPFAGVTVICENTTTTTDNSGQFTLQNLSSATQKKVTLSKGGEQVNVTVQIPNTRELILTEYKNKLKLEFFNQEGAEVKGIKFQLKSPEGNLLVEQHLKNNHAWEGMLKGEASWIGKKLLLSISHEKYADQEIDIKITDKGWFSSPASKSIVLHEKTVTIRGKLINETTGKPIAGATVSVNGTDITTTTNDKGEYELNGLFVEKSYKVVATANGFSKNYVQVTAPNASQKDKIIKIENQEIKIKQNFVAPKTLFGFECSLTKTEASSDGNFDVEGSLKIPTESWIKTQDGKIEFKKIKLNAQGIPLQNSIELGTSLAVMVMGAPAEIIKPTLRWVDNSGKNVALTEEGIGVVSGEVKITSLKIKSGFQGEGEPEVLPELILKNDGIPMGIWCKGTPNNPTIEGLSSFTLQKKQVKDISDLKFTTQGLSFKATLGILGTEFPEVQVQMKPLSDKGETKWDVVSFIVEAPIEAEKELFKLEGSISFADEQGDGTSTFVYVLHSLTIMNEQIQLANENPVILIDEKGKLQDQQILVKGANSDKAGFKLAGQTLSFTNIKLMSAPDEPSLEMEIDASSVFQLLNGDLNFAVTLEQGGDIVASLAAPVKIGMSGAEGTPITGVELSVNSIEGKFGEEEEWKLEGGIEVSFVGKERNSSGTTTQGQEKPISSEFVVVYNKDGFLLEKAMLEIPIQNGVKVGGEIEFPEEGGMGGRFMLQARRGGAEFELNTAFKYIDSEKWNLSIDYKAATAVPLGPYVMGVGLGGSISRYNKIWGIGLRGVFKPNELVLPLLRPAQIYCYLTSEVKFGTDDMGNPLFTLDASGEVQAFDTSFGKGRLTIDFNKKTFEGSVTAMIDRRPFVYADATMDVFIGKNPFVKEDFAAAMVQQQAKTGTKLGETTIDTSSKGKFNQTDILNNELLSGDNPKFIVRFGAFAKMEVLNRPVAKGAFLMGNGLKLHKWYLDLEIERETLKNLMQKNSSNFIKERHNELNELLKSIPSAGIAFNFDAAGSASIDITAGASKISAGYDFNAKSSFVLDMEFSGKGFLNFNTVAHANFKILGWSVAGAKGSSAIKTEWQAKKGVLSYLKGAGNIQVEGYIGNECDCNSACLVGAKGCTNASVQLNYENNQLSTNVSWR